MLVRYKQKIITAIVGIVLDEPAEADKKFPWLINRHDYAHFKKHFPVIDSIYRELKGNGKVKEIEPLSCDAYFGGKYNFLFEFDEIQNFSSARLKALNNYPRDLKLNYSLNDWKKWCALYHAKADAIKAERTTTDFNFKGGRAYQRAYLDCFHDFLPQENGLNPTLRISDFEVKGVYEISPANIEKVRQLVESKLQYL